MTAIMPAPARQCGRLAHVLLGPTRGVSPSFFFRVRPRTVCRCQPENHRPRAMTGWVCTAAITIKVLNPSRSKGFAAAPAVEIWRAIVAKAAEELVRRDRRFADSPLEGAGFEPSVPRLR